MYLSDSENKNHIERTSIYYNFICRLKDLNKALYQADHCKSEILLRFDSHYDQDNKDELLKVGSGKTVL